LIQQGAERLCLKAFTESKTSKHGATTLKADFAVNTNNGRSCAALKESQPWRQADIGLICPLHRSWSLKIEVSKGRPSRQKDNRWAGTQPMYPDGRLS
jgi:hypothetical protein